MQTRKAITDKTVHMHETVPRQERGIATVVLPVPLRIRARKKSRVMVEQEIPAKLMQFGAFDPVKARVDGWQKFRESRFEFGPCESVMGADGPLLSDQLIHGGRQYALFLIETLCSRRGKGR